jgi:membrane-anchored protein YejM (alkaline phosphatase superfamily)
MKMHFGSRSFWVGCESHCYNCQTQAWDRNYVLKTENLQKPVSGGGEVHLKLKFNYNKRSCFSQLGCLGESAPIPYPAAATALPPNMTQPLRRGYYAAVSWTDYLIGELMDTLEAVGVVQNTIIALLGDHGWQLGEHNIWGKHTNFELGTRVPLMISVPGVTTNGNRTVSGRS